MHCRIKEYFDIIFFGYAITFQQLGFVTENFPVFLFLFIIYKFVDYKLKVKIMDFLVFHVFTIILLIVVLLNPVHWKLLFIPSLLIISCYFAIILAKSKSYKFFHYGLLIFIINQYIILFFEGILNYKIIGFSRVSQSIFNFSGSFFEPSYIALFCITIKCLKIILDNFKCKDIKVHLMLDIIILISGSFWGFLLLPFAYFVFFINNKKYILLLAIPLFLILLNLPAFDRFHRIFSQVSFIGIFQAEQSGLMRFAPLINAIILFYENFGMTVTTSNESLKLFITSNVSNVDPVVSRLIDSSNYIIPSIATALLLTGLYTTIPFFIMFFAIGFKPNIRLYSYGFLLIIIFQFLFQSFFTSPFLFCLWYLLSKKTNEKKSFFCKH